MLTARQNQKKQLAEAFVEILKELKYESTAKKLTEQAKINEKNKIDKVLTKIEANSSSKNQKLQQIEIFFTQTLKSQIKKGHIEKAYQIYHDYLPKYFKKFDKFSALFFQTMEEPNSAQQFFQKCFNSSTKIQFKKLSTVKIEKEVYHLVIMNNIAILADRLSNLHVIRNDTVINSKEKVHGGIIMCLQKKDETVFATGGKDRLAKIWNNNLQLLYLVDKHPHSIVCLTFSKDNIVIAGLQGHVTRTQIKEGNQFGETSLAQYRRFSSLSYSETKQLFIGLQNSQNSHSEIIFFDSKQKKQIKTIKYQKKAYQILLSHCEQYLFLNSSSSEIIVYSIKSLQMIHKFKGHIQTKFVMRMSFNQGYLAMTSENGSVFIYSMNDVGKSEKGQFFEVENQQEEENREINCVRWEDENIVVGTSFGTCQKWELKTKNLSKRYQQMPIKKKMKQKEIQKEMAEPYSEHSRLMQQQQS